MLSRKSLGRSLDCIHWFVQREFRAASLKPPEQGVENVDCPIALRKDFSTLLQSWWQVLPLRANRPNLAGQGCERRMQKRPAEPNAAMIPAASQLCVILQRVPPDIKIFTPGLRFFSSSSVRRPRSALRAAANSPAAPAPTTTTSYVLAAAVTDDIVGIERNLANARQNVRSAL